MRRARALALASALLGLPAWAADRPAALQVPDTLAQRLQPCMACHGAQGRAGREGYLPRIAGKPAGYLYQQLLHLRDGRRQNATMARLLAQQTDAYLREMAGYFAVLDLPHAPVPVVTAPPAVLARGQALALQGDAGQRLPACSACHGNRLSGVQPAVPGLLGLPRDYLIAQLGAWQTQQRHAQAPDCMAQIAQRLSPADLGAVATWLAAQPVPTQPQADATAPGPAPMPCGSVDQPPP
ncbi:MAG: c-type cytochrome [Aquabacterium sp.]|nr:c-type cytochrome [Aquabacterium sp.]